MSSFPDRALYDNGQPVCLVQVLAPRQPQVHQCSKAVRASHSSGAHNQGMRMLAALLAGSQSA
jgi:hypothetical protein